MNFFIKNGDLIELMSGEIALVVEVKSTLIGTVYVVTLEGQSRHVSHLDVKRHIKKDGHR